MPRQPRPGAGNKPHGGRGVSRTEEQRGGSAGAAAQSDRAPFLPSRTWPTPPGTVHRGEPAGGCLRGKRRPQAEMVSRPCFRECARGTRHTEGIVPFSGGDDGSSGLLGWPHAGRRGRHHARLRGRSSRRSDAAQRMVLALRAEALDCLTGSEAGVAE